jgi:S-(hydroxymethyl)glutathione dehydrogenase/alcohol dehydrogenase
MTVARAAVVHEVPGVPRVVDVIIDEPGPHEVLVKTAATGVCHSDLHNVDGQSRVVGPPFIPGHEASGIAESVGADVREISAGDHVVSCVSSFCGWCRACLDGKPFRCQRRITHSRSPGEPPRIREGGSAVSQVGGIGGFAERMLVHERTLACVPAAMPLDLAALLGCAVVTGFGAVVRSARLTPGSTAVVVGCGGVGVHVIQAARFAGARTVVAIDRDPSKLLMAAGFGATHTVLAGPGAAAQAQDITSGGADFAFEVVGSPATVEMALRATAPGGSCTVVGLPPDGARLSFPASLLGDDRSLRTCRMGSNRFRLDIPLLADLYLQQRLELERAVTGRFRLDEVGTAFEELRQGRAARSLVIFPA